YFQKNYELFDIFEILSHKYQHKRQPHSIRVIHNIDIFLKETFRIHLKKLTELKKKILLTLAKGLKRRVKKPVSPSFQPHD
ncbi:hypothetical protein BpHYR1_028084, partial [Brachionus plicatilis]